MEENNDQNFRPLNPPGNPSPKEPSQQSAEPNQPPTANELPENFRGPDVPSKNPSAEIRTMKDDVSGSAGQIPAPPKSQPPASKPETDEPVFRPETGARLEQTEEDEDDKRSKKKLIVISGVVLGVVVLALVGYFVIVPILFPPLIEPVQVATETTAPADPAPSNGTPTETPEIITHQSLFKLPASDTVDIELPSFDYRPTVRAFLGAAAAETLPEDSIKEVVLKVNSGQFPLDKFLNNFSVSITDESAPSFIDVGQFEKDFTAFLYYDANGVWPGYVTKIKTGHSGAQVQLNVKSAEPNIDVSAFYLSAYQPGEFGEFKNGQANEIPTRYKVGTKLGAAFNYGVFGDYLILSTSYNGLLKAISLLGL